MRQKVFPFLQFLQFIQELTLRYVDCVIRQIFHIIIRSKLNAIIFFRVH
ncbi:TPA: hypothetical protein I9Y23_005216 [Kluyvera ascorbata]|nr:hypothetical protein [Escherichia coli]HAT3920924.1 hypothetical protein [Kluyvera ascorbata]HBW1724628.1 hypothetical protein [Klebsiella quasipneumoniae subsp. quasipneumoniae]HAT3921475.1 hypothetical protein [Kluyvera ascorbata]HAT3945805.1 hypothetical protein [Kluyvera ascorbata]